MRRSLVLSLLFALGLPAAAQAPDSARADTSRANPRQEGLPLRPTRSLQYTATEGSWMSLDVSPDGRWIVFDLLGDLYLMPFAGGEARALTRGMAFDMQPRFSPDGRRLVFVSDRLGGPGVWHMAVDGSDTVQITTGKTNGYQGPEWAPDGDYIVVSRTGPGLEKLWMYHRTGGSGLGLVTEPANLRLLGAAFGADPRYIWVGRRTGSWTYNSPMGEYDLAVYDRETGSLSTRSSRWGGAMRPTLSPDGRWLVYGSRHVNETGLRIRDLNTGDERWLAYPVQRDEQESRSSRDALPGMSFTPDSRELVASYGGKIWRIPVAGGAAIEIPFRAPVDVDLGPAVDFAYDIPDSATFVARQIRDAQPSPDGRRLAFTVLDQLHVMDWPDGTPRAITETSVVAHQPTWSPDGRWIAYVTSDPVNGGHVMRRRSDGSGRPEQLTRRPAHYQQPAWSPAGDRIVMLRGPARAFTEALTQGVPGGAEDLVWIPAAGGEATVIRPANVQAPHFGANGDRIYASAFGQGLVSFRWDGTDQRAHVSVTGPTPPGGTNPTNASLYFVSPDGQRAIAQVGNEIYTVTIPWTGGATPRISVSGTTSATPSRRLTTIGGQFPTWGRDGTPRFSIGNAHVVYDLDAAQRFDDSVRAARRVPADTSGDSTAARRPARGRTPSYEPMERRVRVAVPRDMPEGTVVFRNARIVTMRGNEVIENGDLLVRNNRIVAVGARGSVEIPAGTREIDASGQTIVPGFVDTHAHIRASFSIHRHEVWSYLSNLAFGVTTTRDPQTGATDVLTYEDLARAGRIVGPRMYSTGPGVFSGENIRNLEDARSVLRRYSEYYDTKTIKMYGAGNREVRQWIIQAARELRIMPTTEGSLDYVQDLTMALDGYSGQEHNTPGFPFYDDVVRLYVASGTAYTPTVLVTYGGPWAENYWYTQHNPFENEKVRRFMPFEQLQRSTLRRLPGWFHPTQHTMDRVAQLVTDIVRAGGVAGVGSHGQFQGLGYHWELWSIAMGGLTPHEMLRVATLLGARAIGLDEQLGSIEPGKLADLVILSANPLENIRNTTAIRYVVLNGRVYEGDMLNEVWPRQRTMGPFYWADEITPTPAAGMR
ncbi:MAG: amidohydrolase family protein [Gemmatimonadales bacterium]